MGAAEQIESPWLNYEEAASYLRLALGTLRNMVSARQIPVYGSRRRRLFRRDMLDLWLANQSLAMRKWNEEITRGRS